MFVMNFIKKFDVLGSMTWEIFTGKIVVLFYFKDENVELEIMCDWLSSYADRLGLLSWSIAVKMMR